VADRERLGQGPVPDALLQSAPCGGSIEVSECPDGLLVGSEQFRSLQLGADAVCLDTTSFVVEQRRQLLEVGLGTSDARVVAPEQEVVLSAASSWEIAIKYALGKLPLPEPPGEYVPSRIAASGTSPLPVEHRHALHVASLPHYHRDPFDRLLVAQSRVEGLALLTSDPAFEAYGVDLIPAS